MDLSAKWATIQGNHAAMDEFMDNMAQDLIGGIRSTEQQLSNRISNLIAEASGDFETLSQSKRMQFYLRARRSLMESVQDSKLKYYFSNYLANYEELAEKTKGLFVDGLIDPAFSDYPQDLIDQLIDRDKLFFNDLNLGATAKLDRQMLSVIMTGANKRGMLEDLQGLITGSYKWGDRRGLYEWHAGTYIRTYHRRFSRNLIKAQAVKHDIKHFIYSGPVDQVTREFCLNLVGHTFTIDQIEDMDNGQTGDVFLDGGGWNCRHQFVPISPEAAQQIGDESLADKAEDLQPETQKPPAETADWPDRPPRFKTKTDAKRFCDKYLMHKDYTSTGRMVDRDKARFDLFGSYKESVDFSRMALDDVQTFVDRFYDIKKTMGDRIGLLDHLRANAGKMGQNTVAFYHGGMVKRGTVIQRLAMNPTRLKRARIEYGSVNNWIDDLHKKRWWASRNLDDLATHESMHWWQATSYALDDAGQIVDWKTWMRLSREFKEKEKQILFKFLKYGEKQKASIQYDILKRAGSNIDDVITKKEWVHSGYNDVRVWEKLKVPGIDDSLKLNMQSPFADDVGRAWWQKRAVSDTEYRIATDPYGWFKENVGEYGMGKNRYGTLAAKPDEFGAELAVKIYQRKSIDWIPAELRSGLDEILPLDYLMGVQ